MVHEKGAAWKTAAAAIVLFAVNAFVTLRLFHVEFTRQMGSIEAAYIGLARYITAHFHDLNWFPLWYGGIPFQDSYPPLLHFVVAVVAAAGRIPPGLAYHAVTASIYALGPAALFWAAWRLGADRMAAFLAALLYSLISPSVWLIREIRAYSTGFWGPHRLNILVHYGEGPHMASLLLLPISIVAFHAAIQKRRPLYDFLAALAIAAVVLSNWLGAFALALAVAAYLLSGFAADWRSAWLRAALIGVWAYAMTMPWIPPSTIATIRANAPLVEGRFVFNAWFTAVFAGGFLALGWALAWWRATPPVRFGALFLYGTAAITLGRYWLNAALVPQPHRYQLEMDMAFFLFAALAAGGIGRAKHGRLAATAVLVACVPVVLHQRAIARESEQPIQIKSTVEYEISTWLGAHMPGRRVFAPGSVGFWMNAFSETPMLTGGFDNGIRNTFLQDVNYQIYAGDRQQVMLDWLKAFGCDAVIASGPESREVFHPYAHPEKFDGLTALWREGGDAIYAVPRGSNSLAHAVLAADLPPERPPAYEPKALAPYLAALENPARPAVSFRWRGQSAAEIQGTLRPEHLLSVQIAWDKGWTARVDGQPRPTWSDKLGQMVIAPRSSGPCTVELTYDGGLEMRIARTLSRAALGGGILWVLLAQIVRRRSSASMKTS